MYIRGSCAPRTPPSGKILTHTEVLVYAYTTVKFQLRSSINVRLTENSLYNRFCIERSPKMGFWGSFGVEAKIFGGNPLGMQRPPICAFSDIFGPDLTRRVVAFCMGIAICHRRKFGQVAPVHSSSTRRAMTRKSRNHSAM